MSEPEKTGKIWGIGLPRTGTTSLAVAMLDLGYCTAHVVGNTDLYSFGDFFCDTPIYLEYRELDQAYPGSKFIYTYRDANKWADSFIRTLLPYYQKISGLPPDEFDVVSKRLWQYYIPIFGHPDTLTKARLIESLNRHRDQVDAYFAQRPDDIFRMNIEEEDALAKLCEFLGKPVDASKKLPLINSGVVRDWDEVKHPLRLDSWYTPAMLEEFNRLIAQHEKLQACTKK